MKHNLWIVIFLSLFLLVVPVVRAQEPETSPVPTESVAQVSSAGTMEYQLPYPGLLPDNPLYPLKTFRDRIISFLISDPAKKAEFDLLQADKRLQAGLYLFNKRQGKDQLAASTISKGANYLEQSISEVKEARKQGLVVQELIKRIRLSSVKHQEVVKSIREKAPTDIKEQLVAIEKKLAGYEGETKKLILK